MNYQQIIDAALIFATSAHEGQSRKDGKPYITHPIAVSEIAVKLYSEYLGDKFDKEGEALITILSYFHDLLEDVEKYKNDPDLLFVEFGAIKDLTPWFVKPFKRELALLNKNNHKNYFEYILAIKNSHWAKFVKRADLKHNLSDLGEGCLKDKYRLAEYILNH